MKYKQLSLGIVSLLTIFQFACASVMVTPVGAVRPVEDPSAPAPTQPTQSTQPKDTEAQGTGSSVTCPEGAGNGDCAEKTAFGFICPGRSTNETSNVGIACLVNTVLNFLSIAVGIAVVAGITIGGIRYSASGGNPSKRQQAISTISNSVLGLVVYLLMYAIIQFLIPGGIFS